MKNDLIIIGAGGHAKVIADMALKLNYNILGFLDDNQTGEVLGYPILGKVCEAVNYSALYVIAIGNNVIRKKIAEQYKIEYVTLIHPSAQIGLEVEIGKGTIVMTNAVINSNSRIGNHSIINTAAIVEHDNIIGDYVHISPNATLCGTVKIGDGAHIGAGAVVKNNITIAENVTVGIGAAVVKNIEESGVYIGVPVRKI